MLDDVFRPGWWGVRIFFALSGYLIGREVLRLLSNGGKKEAQLFLVRRWLRTIPTFWIVLLVTAWSNGIPLISGRVLSNALFLNTAGLGGSNSSIVAVGWSLVIEEWSYAGLGTLVVAASWLRWRPSSNQAASVLAAVALVAIGASIMMRMGISDMQNISFDIIKKTASLQLDSLSYGVLLACLERRWPSVWNRITEHGWLIGLLGWVGMTAVGAWMRMVFQLNTTSPSTSDWLVLGGVIYPISGILCCCFCIGLWSFNWPSGTGIPERAAKMLAKISYSVYLTHVPVKEMTAFQVGSSSGPSSILLWCCYLIASIGFGYLCWQVTERPFMALRRRLH